MALSRCTSMRDDWRGAWGWKWPTEAEMAEAGGLDPADSNDNLALVCA